MHAKNLLFMVPPRRNVWNKQEPLYSPRAQQVWIVETVTIIIGIIVLLLLCKAYSSCSGQHWGRGCTSGGRGILNTAGNIIIFQRGVPPIYKLKVGWECVGGYCAQITLTCFQIETYDIVLLGFKIIQHLTFSCIRPQEASPLKNSPSIVCV